MTRTDLLGAWGEEKAAQYLRKKHYKLLAHRFRCKLGELDLVMQKGNFLVFVEVKLRKNADFAAAREFVDRRKQERLRATAAIYLDRFPTKRQPRFDIIEIYAPQGVDTVDPIILHTEDAFQ